MTLDKRSKILLVVFGVVLLGIVISEVLRPLPIDWSPSYLSKHKKPFGAYVFKEELQGMFSDQEFIYTDKSSFEILDEPVEQSSNYIFINDEIRFDWQSTESILDYAYTGNTVFIASNWIVGSLADTLHFEMSRSSNLEFDSLIFTFTNPALDGKSVFKEHVYKSYFSGIDSSKAEVVAYLQGKDGSKEVSFFRYPIGKGQILISSLPQAFSNYYLLKGEVNYASNAISYLSEGAIYWDEYYKSGKTVIKSPIRFILVQPPLKWAYYICLIGLVLFALFQGKRKQRIIPVITPLKNSSVSFAQAVGTLYFQQRNYDDIMAKRIQFFLEYLRTTYYLDTVNLSDKSAQKLAAKSGKGMEECKEILDYIIFQNNRSGKQESDLLELNKKITTFKKE